MKTVAQRVSEIVVAWNDSSLSADACFDRLESILREALRDQRHLCAEAVNAMGARHAAGALYQAARNDAHRAVINAPEPGK